MAQGQGHLAAPEAPLSMPERPVVVERYKEQGEGGAQIVHTGWLAKTLPEAGMMLLDP